MEVQIDERRSEEVVSRLVRKVAFIAGVLAYFDFTTKELAAMAPEAHRTSREAVKVWAREAFENIGAAEKED